MNSLTSSIMVSRWLFSVSLEGLFAVSSPARAPRVPPSGVVLRRERY